jgi:hypothetical protein
MPIDDLLNRLEAAEQGFAGSQFLAPLPAGAQVAVRIAGIICTLRISRGLPPAFRGWAILRALSAAQAEFLRPASLAERAAYLALFPALRLVLLHPEGRSWLASPAQLADARFRLPEIMPVLLPEEGLERFDTISARFDGSRVWYDRRDPTRDPALGAYLREQITHLSPADHLPPPAENLHKRGLSAEERHAYTLLREALRSARLTLVEERLEEALNHAGARLHSYSERGGAYAVTYEVDGRQHTSLVNPGDLTILTAGICLSGEDQRFDLASLVGVLREASGSQRLVWTGRDED